MSVVAIATATKLRIKTLAAQDQFQKKKYRNLFPIFNPKNFLTQYFFQQYRDTDCMPYARQDNVRKKL